MLIKSEIIQQNIDKVEQAKMDFSILKEYASTEDSTRLRQIWDEGRSYGFLSYMNFIDFQKFVSKNGQEVFYKNKIKIPLFKEILINNAADPSVKKILKSKGKTSFAKLINSPKWDLYSGNRRRRGPVRYNDNFVGSAAIIANFCMQNEIDVVEYNRISEYYRIIISDLDITLKNEFSLTKIMIEYMLENLSHTEHDFKRINVEHLSKIITEELRKKLTNIEYGETVKFIEDTDYYGGLTYNKSYQVLDKEVQSGRLNVIIMNDLGNRRSYPYRIFETVSNLRNGALDSLLNDL